jgi:hypothetical protein
MALARIAHWALHKRECGADDRTVGVPIGVMSAQFNDLGELTLGCTRRIGRTDIEGDPRPGCLRVRMFITTSNISVFSAFLSIAIANWPTS